MELFSTYIEIIVSSIIMLNFQFVYSENSTDYFRDFEPFCDGEPRTDYTILRAEDMNYPISFYLICGFITENFSLVSSGLNASISEIQSLSHEICDLTNITLLTSKHNRSEMKELKMRGDTMNADLLRSRSIKCLDYEFKSEVSTHTDLDNIIVRNSIDLILGFIDSEKTYWKNIVADLKHVSVVYNFVDLFPEVSPKEFTHDFYVSDNMISNMSLHKPDDRNLIVSPTESRILESRIFEISKSIRAMFCVDTLLFDKLINELSVLHLSILIYTDRLSKKDYFRFKYNSLMNPDYLEFDNVMMWISFRDYNIKDSVTELLNIISLENSTVMTSDPLYYDLKLQDIRNLFETLENKFIRFYRKYIEVQQGIISTFRGLENVSLYVDSFLNTTLCNLVKIIE